MTATALDTFRTRLVAALTDADRRESEAEAKRGRANIYRLGHYLNAAEAVCEAIADGQTPARAFAENFNPTRDLHRVAKALSLPIAVERGRWLSPQPATA